jgi:hypothetical protein
LTKRTIVYIITDAELIVVTACTVTYAYTEIIHQVNLLESVKYYIDNKTDKRT